MSIIVVTPDGYDTIRNLVDSLKAQTVREALELIIVAPAAESLQLAAPDFGSFGRWQILELNPIRTVAQAKALAVRYAHAPVVAFTEDHSLPSPTWAQALVAAHGQGWAAVGPAMENGNPGSLISWADFIIGYGPWSGPGAARELDSLPGHNTSYKRSVLLECGERLEELLGAEYILQEELRAKGHRLYLEPAAQTFHSNFSQFSRWVPYLCYSGRLFAARRAERWHLLQRASYSAGAWLIPVVRLGRLARQIRCSRPDLLPRLYVPLFFALTIDAGGQWLGYTFGPGGCAEKLMRLEFHRNATSEQHSRLQLPTGAAEQRQ